MNIYVGLIISGFTVLLLSLFVDSLDFLDFDFDTDFGDVEIFDLDIQFIPISVKSICLALIVFSSLQLSFNNAWLSLGCAYLSAVLVQTLLRYLKKHQSESESEQEVVGLEGVLEVKVTADGTGSIIIEQEGKSTVSFPAVSEDKEELSRGSVVKIVAVNGGIAVVKGVNK